MRAQRSAGGAARQRRYSPNGYRVNRWYRELAVEAEIREITSRGARHTSGSSYSVLGASQKAIAVMLGHANTKATERYAHLQVDATAPLVEARWAKLTGPVAS
jgi:integrase